VNHNKRILFISYFYPPLGGPGVQRPIKTIKYLSAKGWKIDVLTVKDIQFHSYDYKLLEESKAENIYRTFSYDVMSLYKLLKNLKSRFNKTDIKKTKTAKDNKDKIYFKTPEAIKMLVRGIFPIDDKIGWLPCAYSKAINLCRQKEYNAIIATMGPYTSGIIALKIHEKLKIPFFIDYRDHWTLNAYPQYSFRFLKKHAEHFERILLNKAYGISVVGSFMKDKLCDFFGKELNDKIEVIYNGYDEDDFSEYDRLSKANTKFVFRYIGNFYGYRNVSYFVKALKFMVKTNQLPDNVIFEFVGNYYVETLDDLNNQELKDFIKISPQVEHKTAVELIHSADVLLLFIPDINSDDVIPGKIFEYLRAKKPILAMIPENGEPAKILKEAGHTYFSTMENIDSIIDNLKHLINALQMGDDFGNSFSDEKIVTFSRENQSYKLEKFINKQLLSVKRQ